MSVVFLRLKVDPSLLRLVQFASLVDDVVVSVDSVSVPSAGVVAVEVASSDNFPRVVEEELIGVFVVRVSASLIDDSVSLDLRSLGVFLSISESGDSGAVTVAGSSGFPVFTVGEFLGAVAVIVSLQGLVQDVVFTDNIFSLVVAVSFVVDGDVGAILLAAGSGFSADQDGG